eukprot:scaffold4827_cov48-Phaeocystis_antarctica.AAC.3
MISPGLGSKNSWGPERCTLPSFAVEAWSGGRVERGGAAGDGVYFEVEDDGGRGGGWLAFRGL